MIHDITQLDSLNVHQIVSPYARHGDTPLKLLMSADWHWDNPKCDRGMMKEHFDEAVNQKAGILGVGDLFCAMQGKYDKRASKADLRPEHQVNNYLDALVETMAEWLEPYKENLLLISPGNHESSVLKRMETDLIARLAAALGTGVAVSTYGGYLKLVFYRSKDGKAAEGNDRHCSRSLLIKNFHGYGGGGAVTKGVIQSFRQSVIYPDADIIFSGHVHDAYMMEQPQERVNIRGKLFIATQYHIRTPTYKEEFQFDKGGFHTEKGSGPKPLGSWMVDFKVKNIAGDIRITPYRMN